MKIRRKFYRFYETIALIKISFEKMYFREIAIYPERHARHNEGKN